MARTPSIEVYAPLELIEQIEAYRDKHDLDNTSDAARELWRRALQREDIVE